MKLFLLRHAKTDQNVASGNDFDRKLLPKGRAQCAMMREYLQDLPPIRVWCSDARRTRETLKLIKINSTQVTYSSDLYLCSLGTYLDKLWESSGNGDLFIVGHNFGISELAAYFSGEQIEMGTGELICLEFNVDEWKETSRGNGTIVDRYRPVPSSY